MSPPGRAFAAAVLGAGIAALALAADRDALARTAASALARTELAELDRVAGLRDAAGTRVVTTPVGVDVAVDGPAWVDAAIEEAVARDDVYALGTGPHRILGELVVTRSAVALRLSLERRGWVLHAPTMRRRLQPELVVAGALAGAGAWAWSRSRALGLALAGLVAQLALILSPRPAELPPQPFAAELASGPLGEWIVALARGMDDTAFALAAGVVVLGAVLALFDQRRARAGAHAKSGVPLAWGLAGCAGALAWIEAAGRASLLAWTWTAGGLVALAAAVGLVVLVHAHHRRTAVAKVGP
jgi:hypothetical protein